MSRVYLEAVFPVLGCWRRRNLCSAAGTVLGTLSDGLVIGVGNGIFGGGAVLGPGNGTLGCGNVVVDVVGRCVASILCRVLMVCIC